MTQLTAQAGPVPAHRLSRPSLIVEHPWCAVRDLNTSCLVLPPAHDTLSAAVDEVTARSDVNLRMMGGSASLKSAMHRQLPARLADYIAQLVETYGALMGGPVLRVRLETVRSKACWKWHRDYTTLRLITALRGAGTHYLPDPSKPDDIASLAEGEIGLFKGRLFGAHVGEAGHEACVHRSPPFDGDAAPRLLLVIDMPQDFEIENAEEGGGVI